MIKKLMPYEYKWIARRLKIYDIKYAEIYNEIYDHMVSAVEGKRSQEDSRPILVLFQETMDQDIGSHRGIADMTDERKSLVRGLLNDGLKDNFLAYFRTWKALWFVGAIVLTYGITSLLGLPVKGLWIPLFLLSLAPFVYFLAYGTIHKYLRTVISRRKTSLVNSQMIETTGFGMLILNLIIFVIPMALFIITGTDFDQGRREFMSFMGVPGMSVLAGLAFIFAKAAIALFRTDYRQMIRQIAGS